MHNAQSLHTYHSTLHQVLAHNIIMGKNLDYIVFEDFKVHLITEQISTSSNPLFFIKSKWIKKSSGQRLYDYYENIFYDVNHNELPENKIIFNGFTCEIEKNEIWRTIHGNSASVTLKVLTVDKLGAVNEQLINMHKEPMNRFDEIFNYLNLVNLYGTHEAVSEIMRLEEEILKLKK